MPKESIYANIHNRLPNDLKVFTKEELNLMGQDFVEAVSQNEVSIFVNYISHIVIGEAELNNKRVVLPVLPKGVNIMHDHNGLLDKKNPGPIPEIYLDRILQSLNKIFPDIDIIVINGKMIIEWL
jgi:hypothetical protein